jgi:hypothetical protein
MAVPIVSLGKYPKRAREGIVMKQQTLVLLFVLATVPVATVALLPKQNSTPQDAAAQGNGNAVQSQSSALRILGPRPGQALKNDFVIVRFELMQPNPAGGDNNFVVQLDALDSVHTSDTQYTFTGLRPGQHVLTVTEVDANRNPLPGRIAVVQFSVDPPDGAVPPAQSGGKSASDR